MSRRRRSSRRRLRSNPSRRMRRNDSAPRSRRGGKAVPQWLKDLRARDRASMKRGPFVPMSAEEAATAPRRRARKAKKARKERVGKMFGPVRRTLKQKHRARRAAIRRLRKARGKSGRSAAFVRRTAGRRLAKRISSGKTTVLREMARRSTKKRGASAGMRSVASAWRAAHRAKRSARSPEEVAYLRAAGLAAVPNRSLIGPLKDFTHLLPQIGVGTGALVGVALVGQMIGSKLAASLPAAVAAHAPAIASGALTVAAYLLARNVKALAKFSLPIVLGGAAATVIHLLRSIKVGAAGAEVSLAAKMGLPLGEYTAMGEYTSMGGRDDDAQFVDGLDDEPDYDSDGAGDDDSVGGIFDKPIF